MGRRSDHSATELVSMTVDAAEKIVVQEGVVKLSVRRIAAHIGYSPSALYHHFDGITEVVDRVNYRTLKRLEAELMAQGDAECPETRLLTFSTIYLNFIKKNEPLWGLLFQFSRPEGVGIPTWYTEQIETLIALITRCFEDMAPSKGFTPRQSAEMLWTSVHSVCSLETSDKLSLVSDRSLDQFIRDLVGVHVAAYKSA